MNFPPTTRYIKFAAAILVLLFFNSFSVTAQQLDFEHLGPFSEIRIGSVKSGGEHLFMTTRDTVKLYISDEGDAWNELFMPDTITTKSFFDISDNEFICNTDKGLYRVNSISNTWTNLLSSSENIYLHNDSLYVASEDNILLSVDNGLSYNPIIENLQDTNYRQVHVTDKYIFLSTVDGFYIYKKNGQLEQDVSDIIFGGFSLNFVVTADNTIYFNRSFGSGNDLQPYQELVRYDVASSSSESLERKKCYWFNSLAINNDIVFSHSHRATLRTYNQQAINDEAVYQVNSPNRLISHKGKLYGYNNSSLAEIVDFENNNVRNIPFNFSHEHYNIISYKLAPNGILIASTNSSIFTSIDNGDSWNKIEIFDDVMEYRVGYENSLYILGEHSDHWITNLSGPIQSMGETINLGLDHSPSNATPPYAPPGTSLYPFVNSVRNFYFINDTLNFYMPAPCTPPLSLNNGWVNPASLFDITPTSELIEINDEIFTTNILARLNLTDYTAEDIFQDINYSRSDLYVNDNLIHINPLVSGIPSIVTKDFGLSFDTLGFGPPGRILKAKGEEGTFVDRNRRIFFRDFLDSDYSEIDLSSLNLNQLRESKSNSEGVLFGTELIGNKSYLVRINNNIQHTQKVKGAIFVDENGNCTLDNGEGLDASFNTNLNYVTLENQNYNTQNFVNSGMYEISCPIGDYQLELNSPYSNIEYCPNASTTININQQNQELTHNIGIQSIEACAFIESSLELDFLRSCSNRTGSIYLSNFGNLDLTDINATLITDSEVEITTASLPFTKSNDTTYVFQVDPILAKEKTIIDFEFMTACGIEFGYLHCFDFNITGENLCSNSNGNTNSFYGISWGPFDPNDLTAFNEQGHNAYSFDKGEDHHYRLRFQNTGNDTAFNVKVITDLDHNLDIRKLKIKNSSHEMITSFNDANNLVFTFDNIMLPDSNVNLEASNGFVDFVIPTYPDIDYETQINSHSDIYFDFNAPITTNMAETIIRERCGELLYDSKEITICEGENIDGYERDGIYYYHIINEDSCEVFRSLNLTVKPRPFTFETERICEGDSYLGHTTTQSVYDTLQAVNGCDSIHRLNIIVNEISPNISVFEQIICQGEAYEGYTETGIYLDTIWGFSQCRVEQLELTVIDADTSFMEISICENETFNGYTEAGIYVDSITSSSGCVGYSQLELFINESEESSIDTTICSGTNYLGFDTDGDFMIELETINGCDSQLQ